MEIQLKAFYDLLLKYLNFYFNIYCKLDKIIYHSLNDSIKIPCSPNNNS